MKEQNAHTDDITIGKEATEQEVRPQLQLGHMIPDFRLESTDGRVISPMDYKERKNLVVIFFNPRSRCELEALALVRQRYHEITDENAEVLAIASGPMEELKTCVTALQPPFPLLNDTREEATCAYRVTEAELFVADRFGELKMLGPLCDDLDKVLDQVISTLGLIELECPECGVSSWPQFGI